MNNSTQDHESEETREDIRAQTLVKLFKREARLRQIAEQSAFAFFVGDTLISRILRISGIVLLLGVITIYLFSDAFAYSGIWPLIAIAGFIEALRANRRLDAMIELQLFAEQNYPDKSTQSANSSESGL
jgi:hypothetical protein